MAGPSSPTWAVRIQTRRQHSSLSRTDHQPSRETHAVADRRAEHAVADHRAGRTHSRPVCETLGRPEAWTATGTAALQR
jgi:hypothetical protein